MLYEETYYTVSTSLVPASLYDLCREHKAFEFI